MCTALLHGYPGLETLPFASPLATIGKSFIHSLKWVAPPACQRPIF